MFYRRRLLVHISLFFFFTVVDLNTCQLIIITYAQMIKHKISLTKDEKC